MQWRLILKTNKTYRQNVDKPIHLSMAALDHTTADDLPVQVKVYHEGSSFLLCTLQKGKVYQCALDLNIENGPVRFYAFGNGTVYLSGSLIDKPESDVESDDEEMKADKDFAKFLDKIVKKYESDDDDKLSSSGEKGESSSNDSAVSDDDSMDNEEVYEGENSDDDESEEENEPPKKKAKTDDKATQVKEKVGVGKVIEMQGGLKAQDLKIGYGVEAKIYNFVRVYYVGRLEANDEVFELFNTGRGDKIYIDENGEEIEGLVLGIVGMKIGGKRRLVIPPSLAYGAKGTRLVPPNSTVVYDVELKEVY